ncbi:MAG TPA: restriction endonuclease subunit S [Acidimicrobiales bacterium]|nr:restriction endonuclease subunit S [Acidimicrobiales bacterium]
MPRTSWDKVGSYVVEDVALDGQRAIADFLDTEAARIDALIAKKCRMIELLKDQLAERVRCTVLLEQWYEDPLQVSRREAQLLGVRAMRLSWMAAFGSGTTPAAGSDRYYGGDIPWVLTGDLPDGEVNATTRSVTEEALADHSALKVYPAGSLVVAMYGATIGKMGILRIGAAVNQACCVIAPGPDLDTDFLYFYMFGFRNELIERGRGSGQPNISQEILRSLRLAVPPVDRQRALVAELRRSWERVERATTALVTQIELLQEHRQALITAAVTGELEVPGVAA